MPSDRNDEIVGSDAIAVEILVVTLISLILGLYPADWKYFWIFQLSPAFLITIMILRSMAGKADDPNIDFIQKSLPLSSNILQFSMIGVLVSITLGLNSSVAFIPPAGLFSILAVAFTVLFICVNQLVLGEYVRPWKQVVYQETEDDLVGDLLRGFIDFAEEEISETGNDNRTSRHSIKFAIYFSIFTVGLILITLPVWAILSLFLDPLVAVLTVFSVLILRDQARYIYFNYGAAEDFSEIRFPLKQEFIISIGKGILIIGALGYDLQTIL
ncbi:hypothetical protein Huta_2531 [Halorhabdus utahensis DSM 12940]|uniref:Uncharacterized protein n=1 Tax=Halorhabdus utahensis (strain DSM 12940 / JCM 11049 / AX-2) TaxID=519442 RepID=C7NMZ7_HALUD|nr:hypothetical protein [Halorhabdus utahensis]ACV12695.1 hypothetical protein Huta_2531 [Halorhabdus utahensis DSM 12940]